MCVQEYKGSHVHFGDVTVTVTVTMTVTVTVIFKR